MSTTAAVSLPYGQGRIEVRLPRDELLSVVVPRDMAAVPNPGEEIRRALDNPIASDGLEGNVVGARKVTVVVNDSTRPTPTWLVLPILLGCLKALDVPKPSVELLVATGLHRPSTREELQTMLGEKASSSLRVANHDAFDPQGLGFCGRSSHGTPLWFNKRILESDAVISLGYIEPHFFAGYTGGGKMILPGVAGVESIMANHGARMIDHPKARAGVLEGNPIREDNVEAARAARLSFILDVTLNREKRLAKAVAGDVERAHRESAQFIDRFVRVKACKADVVVTSNSGYPLDRDLYQAVKGMAAAEPVVKDGGFIVVASECRDGIAHPNFERMVAEAKSPEELLERIRTPGFAEIDQWEAQIMARVQCKADVIMVTSGISRKDLARMHLGHAASLEDALAQARSALGRRPEVTVIPDGPYTIVEPSTGL